MPVRVDWNSPEDKTVIAALGLKCPACKALPWVACRSVIDGQPLHNRIIHFCRIEVAA